VRDAGHIGMGVAAGAGARARAQPPRDPDLFPGRGLRRDHGLERRDPRRLVAPYKIPTLGISEAFNQAPLVISGALIVVFSIEHVIALIRGEEVKPAWH